jgi:hypothetical protein
MPTYPALLSCHEPKKEMALAMPRNKAKAQTMMLGTRNAMST